MTEGNHHAGHILPEDTKRTSGRNAQQLNILAAKLVAETVRTTLGPKGMDKMIVDGMGEVVVTNDGVTILEEIHLEHPVAKMIVEVAKTQENEVGDGTTTAVVLAGELLKQAERLLEQKVHPTLITKGYQLASEKAQEILKGMAEDVLPSNGSLLLKMGSTAMTGKGAEIAKDHLSKLAVDAVASIRDKESLSETIKVEKKLGGRVEDSELIRGIVLDKERLHSSMPKDVSDARIALLDCSIEVKSTETDAKIQITDPEKMQSFLDMEEAMLKKMVERILHTGATVVLCQKGVDDLAQHFLAKAGVYCCRRVKKSDMEKLAKATSGRIVSSIDDLSDMDLGRAGVVQEVMVNEEGMTYVRNCQNPQAVTLLIRGGSDHVIQEVERAMEDALGVLETALREGHAVGGAGSAEIRTAIELRKFAERLSGREQLAIHAFANALEVIPTTLAENAGLDPLDVLTELKAAHEQGERWAGINVFSGKVMNGWEEGVIEPLQVKTQAISSASEVATMILRIDDVIAGKPEGREDRSPGAGLEY